MTIFEYSNLPAKGIIHIGACTGEELQEHEDRGAEKIIWVEANPYIYPELLENLKNSKIENYPFLVACTDKDDEMVDFNILYDPGNKGCSSLLYPKNHIFQMYQETISAQTITIDSLIKRNNFKYEDFQLLDIDVQGAELLVLRGAEELLKHVDYISLEVTFHSPYYYDNPFFEEILEFLNSKGFKNVENKFYESSWADGLFVREI
jgi:FkbM family methyltransferase